MLTNIKFTYYVINLLKMRYFVFRRKRKTRSKFMLLYASTVTSSNRWISRNRWLFKKTRSRVCCFWSSFRLYLPIRLYIFVKQIIEDTDLVLCFYNGDKHTSVIPVDIAKEVGIDAVIYDLPGLYEKQMKKSFEQKFVWCKGGGTISLLCPL